MERKGKVGQVLLPAVLLAFSLALTALVVFDLGLTIERRILAQNAVDAAADMAALWQARGCNLLQHLNNMHWQLNSVFYVAEMAALAACMQAAGSVAIVGGAGETCALCLLCKQAPYVDKAQEETSAALLKMADGITKSWPVMIETMANKVAKENGADLLAAVLPEYMQGPGGRLGLPLGVEIGYAAPLEREALGLGVKLQKEKKWPWYFSPFVAGVMARAGAVCEICGLHFTYDLPKEWGWEDGFYAGQPRFMTWMSGKKGQNSFRRIPALLGLASAQVEGMPVVGQGEADAHGCLITVQIRTEPGVVPGEEYGIYH